MATYTLLKNGSKGSEVSTLQTMLNNLGYSLSVDGIYGSKTQAAVQDYQSKNNLTVDGIVGNNTWSSLYGSGSSSSSSSSSTADWLASYEGGKPSYTQSQAVTDAANMLSQYEGKKPGEYQSAYSDQIQAMLDKILSREDFKYDFNADPLYQQYKDQYTQQGKLAMMDTMGNAAALTGGYGSSYASTAGNQAYQGYLQGLNNVIPELYDAAYNRYQDQGDKMVTDFSLLQGMDQSDYGRYRDTVSDYYTDLQYYYNKYNDMSQAEYNRYLNDLSSWESDRAYWYQKSQDEQSQSNWEAEYNLALQSAKSGGSSSGSSGSGYNNGSLTAAQIKEMQAYYGVDADGKWGSKSTAAAGGLSADAAWAAMGSASNGTYSLMSENYDSSGSYSYTEDGQRQHTSGYSHAWATVRNMYDSGASDAEIANYIDRVNLAEWEKMMILGLIGKNK